VRLAATIPVNSQSGGAGDPKVNCSTLRWGMCDEISQLSAELLAMLERKFRNAVPAHNDYRYSDEGIERLFGGINMILVGDFHQLRPTGGTPLSTPPDHLLLKLFSTSNNLVQHGLSIIWDHIEPENFIELVKQVRITDEWWSADIESQMRQGCMSDNSYDFLMGNPTTVHGSWIHDRQTSICRLHQPGIECARLTALGYAYERDTARSVCTACCEIEEWLNDGAVPPFTCTPEDMKECTVCRLHRRKRCVLASGPDDPRFTQAGFRDGRTLVYCNSPDKGAAKQRACQYAKATGQRILWVAAKDYAQHESLSHDPELMFKKTQCCSTIDLYN
jgi:hypothetical protein